MSSEQHIALAPAREGITGSGQADSEFEGGDDDGGDDDNGGVDIDFGTVGIEVELTNTGVFREASGDAKLEPRADRTDFSVEIEDVPVGSYSLRIGGDTVGTIVVVKLQDGSVEGELEFRNPQEPGLFLHHRGS